LKILIIATQRSGGTALTNGIGLENYYRIHEPFVMVSDSDKLIEYPIKKLEKYNNTVVRTLSQQKPPSIKYNITNFHQILAKDFDKVICLDRLNTKEHEKSHINLLWKMQNKQLVTNTWQIDEIPQQFIDEYYRDNQHHILREQKEQLKLSSDVLKVPITWYEDLYSDNRTLSFATISKLGLDLDSFSLNETLHPAKKYRQFNARNII
jgi:hypothetical protein